MTSYFQRDQHTDVHLEEVVLSNCVQSFVNIDSTEL